MLHFLEKFKTQLTENEIVLLSDKWISPSKDLTIQLNAKWAKTFFKKEAVRQAVNHEFTSKKNETIRNQEILQI